MLKNRPLKTLVPILVAFALLFVAVWPTSAATRTTQSIYVNFDGVDDDITISDDTVIQNIWDGGGTLEAWIYPESDGEGNEGRIADKNKPGDDGWVARVTSESDGSVSLNFQITFDSQVGQWQTSTRVIPLNEWSHIAITYNSNAVGNDPIFYVDGTSTAITELTTPIGTRTTDASNDFVIGGNGNGGVTFDGFIDDPRLWSDIRSAGEISANYVGQLVGNDANLVGYWPLIENTGTFTTDYTGNLNFGTLSGATWGQDNDVSDAELSANLTITNTTADDMVWAFGYAPLSTQGLIDTNLVNSNALDVDIQDALGNSVPFTLGSGRSAVKGCHIADGVGAYIDDTTDCNDTGIADVPLTMAAPVVDEGFVIQGLEQYTAIWFDIHQPAGYASTTQMTVTWEYCVDSVVTADCPFGEDATRWRPLENVVDGTNSFRKAGTHAVTFDYPNDEGFTWDEQTTNSISGFTVQARITSLGTGDFTQPLANQIWVEKSYVIPFVSDLTNSASENLTIYAGQSKSREFSNFMLGVEGFQTADNAAIEPGGDFTIEIRGYFHFASSATPLVFKNASDFDITFSGTGFSYEVGATTGSFTGLTSGIHTLTMDVDPVSGIEFWWNGVSVETAAADTVPDNANAFEWPTNASLTPLIDLMGMNYIEYIKLFNGNSLSVFYQPQTVWNTDGLDNLATPGSYEGQFEGNTTPSLGRGGFLSSTLHPEITTTLQPFKSTAVIADSPNASTVSQIVNDVTGSAEGTAFAGASNPSSSLPGYDFLNNIATRDYDPTQVGVQGVPIAFFYILILGAILILAMVAVVVVTKSFFYGAITVGLLATLFVGASVISPWVLMLLAIPPTIWFLSRGGLGLD